MKCRGHTTTRCTGLRAEGLPRLSSSQVRTSYTPYAPFSVAYSTEYHVGTLVSVMVCVEEIKDGGYPSASFVIDGQNYGTVAASPSSTESLFNITLFTSPNLPAGEHTLVVTNLNGTRPNVFWLDRIWYISSAVSNSTSSRCAFSRTNIILILMKLTATFQRFLRNADRCYVRSQSEPRVFSAQLRVALSNSCSSCDRSLWKRKFCGESWSEPWSHHRGLYRRRCSAHSPRSSGPLLLQT